ncbi:MAG: 4-hydroxy-3-methylbut-2-enyl diphosphate reductase [Rikenellaceae bacterium]|nr:4-hydroxy-3-methylbut-2-enyl diphosphate reductase [Rikenellaceae bacterium]
MRIEIDEKSGFCFGVVNAISQAEICLEQGLKIFCLGDIVHNRVEVSRLESLGLGFIGSRDIFSSIAGETVLIRAHGEPPATYRLAEEYGIRLIDATCPVVAGLQKKTIGAHRKMQESGGQVVILGKKGHAEVVGLTGQVGEDALVVENIEDIDAVDFTRPVYLLSQTTQSLELFSTIKEEIIKRSQSTVTVRDTICRNVSDRNPHLKKFAANYDVVIFVSGKKSSNGQALFETCAGVNPRSYKVEDESEILPEWFENCSSVGICGATSTPKWLMEKIAVHIKELCG